MRRRDKQLGKVALIPAGFEAFVLKAKLGALILLQPVPRLSAFPYLS
jgi:hypothetical protein